MCITIKKASCAEIRIQAVGLRYLGSPSGLCLESTTFFFLFCAFLETAHSEWNQSVASFGLDFGDGLPELLDLRFADGLLLFARSAQDAAKLLDDLVRCCSGAGLHLNVTKTNLVTSEAQAPAQLLTPAGSIVDILPPDASRK